MAQQRTRDDALMERYIEPDPHRPGRANARLVDYGTHVWALIGHYKAVGGDALQVAREYDLPLEAVEAALAYYRRHKKYIDATLLLNSDY